MKIRLALVLCLFSIALHASQQAVTDEGDIVILNDDGTWAFENPGVSESVEIPVNEQAFERSPDSSFRLKSTHNDAAVWLNTKKWVFEKNKAGESTEYGFKFKEGDLYGMLITEGVEIELESLIQIAFENAKSAAPDATVTEREYRIVNGNRVIYMEMQGTIQSIKFTYFGYYFSNETGSTQFMTYTGTNLIGRYKTDIQDFLNGFATQ